MQIRKIIILILLAAFVMTSIAIATTDEEKIFVLKQLFNAPDGDWNKIARKNERFIDNSLLEFATSNLDKAMNTDKDDEAWFYANVADFLAGFLGKKGTHYRLNLAKYYIDKRNNGDVAISICRNILIQDPKNLDVMRYLGEIFTRARLPSDALTIWENILKINPRDEYAMEQAARIHYLFEEIDKGEELCRKILEINPKNKFAREKLGKVIVPEPPKETPTEEPKETPKAEVEKEQPKEQPKNEPVSSPLSKNKEAMEHFTKAETLYSQSEWKGAEDEYRLAIQADKGFARAYIYLGDALIKQDRYDEAIKALGDAVKLSPRDPQTYHFLGFAYEKQFNLNKERAFIENAIENYRKACEIDPSYAPARRDLRKGYVSMGVYLTREGEFADAEAALNLAREMEPKMPEAYFALGMLFEKEYDISKIKEFIEKSVANYEKAATIIETQPHVDALKRAKEKLEKAK